MTIVLRPQVQREAETVFDWAKRLILARGNALPKRPGYRILMLRDLIITIDEAAESNTLSIALCDQTKMLACWCDDGLPVLFLDFHPEGFWKFQIKRALDANYNKRKPGDACSTGNVDRADC